MKKNNWIIDNIDNSLRSWNDKLAELWELITVTPQDFKGGEIWNIMVTINESLKGIGYGLLILFIAIGIFGSAASFREFRRPEHVLRHFIRFVAAKTCVGYCMDIMTAIFSICGGVVASMATHVGGITGTAVSMPDEIAQAIDNMGFISSVPLWLITLLGSILITCLSFIMIMTVYSRFFKLYIYTALAPLPLSALAGEGTAGHAKAFLKSYVGVCLEGGVIVLAAIIFGAFVSGTPYITEGEPFVMAYAFVGETVFNMLVLVGLVKAADRIVKELFGL